MSVFGVVRLTCQSFFQAKSARKPVKGVIAIATRAAQFQERRHVCKICAKNVRSAAMRNVGDGGELQDGVRRYSAYVGGGEETWPEACLRKHTLQRRLPRSVVTVCMRMLRATCGADAKVMHSGACHGSSALWTRGGSQIWVAVGKVLSNLARVRCPTVSVAGRNTTARRAKLGVGLVPER